ncbi:DUF4228 domain protein [Senna tora]|uniref:DUF4228 domain protein n=1 Tax=Senna tora TaxID=362788 RepID=A0A834TR57_9FABA|nr:DUF4228 domain protein [Senna tora]
MGNAASCTPSLMKGNNGGGTIKVLSLDGRLESYTRAVRAAELMVENQGQFVCDSSFLKVGHRIQGLLADEELEKGRFYFLLPMELLYSVLTHEEICSMNYRASRALKHNNNNNSKIGGFNNLGKKKVEKKCFTKQGSWRPSLETIDETP